MSAPAAGKFQDHYAVLDVDPQADSDAIQAAYAKLAQRYHPNNAASGDAEKFEAVNLANEVLSDAELRSGFDKIKGVGQDQSTPKFTGVNFFDAFGREKLLRVALLCVLYDRRQTKPAMPSMSMRHLEGILETTPEELAGVLWYLKQRNLVRSDDKSSLHITVDGMDFLENRQPSPDEIMRFIKPDAIAGGKTAAASITPAAVATPPVAKAEAESVRSVLNRVLARV
jgi:curved DNA-binding protein CbpA